MKIYLTGIVSGLLAVIGPSLLIVEATKIGGLSEVQMLSWFFAVYFMGGLYSVFLPFVLKIPATGSHSISSIAYIISVIPIIPFEQLIGGFLISGLIVFVFASSERLRNLILKVPVEITNSMLSGILLSLLVSQFLQFYTSVIFTLVVILIYYVSSIFLKQIPPIIIVIISIISYLLITQNFPYSSIGSFQINIQLHKPTITILNIAIVGIPLAILVIFNDILIGLSTLGEKVKNPTMILKSGGVFSIIGSIFGSPCTNLAGVMTIICNDIKDVRENKKYLSSVVSGFVLLGFAFSSSIILPIIIALPLNITMLIAFLTILPVFLKTFNFSFKSGGRKLVYTIPTFIISSLPISIFVFSSPLIGLIVGCIIYFSLKLFKRSDK